MSIILSIALVAGSYGKTKGTMSKVLRVSGLNVTCTPVKLLVDALPDIPNTSQAIWQKRISCGTTSVKSMVVWWETIRAEISSWSGSLWTVTQHGEFSESLSASRRSANLKKLFQ